MVQASPETWDEVARHYTGDITLGERSLATEITDLLGGIGLAPPARLIEIGAGSGHLSLMLREQGYRTTLLDFSPVALQHAREVFAAQGFDDKNQFVLGDALDLPDMGLERFDLAWSSGVCEHFDAARLQRMLQGMASIAHRVLVIVPNPDSLFYLAGRRRQTERCTWNVGVELLRRNYEEIFRSAGLSDIRRGFIGRDWTRAWISLAVGEDSAPLFEQLLAEGQISAREFYLQYFIAQSESDGMRAEDEAQASHREMDADAFDRTFYMDALGSTMVALSKMREETDRLKAEAFSAEAARAAAQSEVARLTQALNHAQASSTAASATQAEAAEMMARFARNEQSLHEMQDRLTAAARHIESLGKLCDDLLQRATAAEADRDSLLTSTSWRITAPLRVAITTARRAARGATTRPSGGPRSA